MAAGEATTALADARALAARLGARLR